MICLGLCYTHKNKIIHRDIAPKNLLIKQRGPVEDVILLSDFGVSQLEFLQGVGTFSQRVGTLPYSPPESFKVPKEPHS